MKENITIIFKIVKWVFRSVFVILGILPFSRCSSGYKEKDGVVTFNGREIKDKSFSVLNEEFAKSDSAVYYKRYSIANADIKTFVALDAHYAKDKNTAYYCDVVREGQNYYTTIHSEIVKIKGVHSESFKLLGSGYEGFAKDKKQAYLKGIGFQVKDVATLEIVDGQFLKDKYQVYFQQRPIENADVDSFRILNSTYAKDTARVYYFGYHDETNNGIHEIPCKTNSFRLLEYPYSKDETSVYYIFTKIKDADAKSFSVIGNGFSKDKNHVYFETEILQGADASSFIIIPHEESLDDFNFTKDENHIFYQDKMMSVKDIQGFKVLGLEYSTDNIHVYHGNNIVKNADPKTFKVYQHGYGDEDAEDAKNKYLAGKKVSK